ncbi:PIG-L deacetylase family protein [Speluncibacter jeojiensis]|uniref:PIG-L family deacetylase n=1 Tax=Speluncibacter jeojiensis TaxID=2710754 RepID=A0A9X4M0B0_9ACTN|nr:PIG-L family deacetylase [Corynebacteriales bacterium D3-21]
MIEPFEPISGGNSRCAFIFAHYDDAALDAAALLKAAPQGSIDMVLCSGVPTGALNRLRQSAIPAWVRRQKLTRLVFHAFGRPVYGEWDDQCGFTVPTQEVMRVREQEHEQVCEIFGVDTFGLDVLDNQYAIRGGRSFEEAVARAIELVRERQIERVVTHPLNAAHPDHAKTVRLAKEVCKATGAGMINVCERPYTVCEQGECAYSNTDNAARSTTLELDDEAWPVKYEAVSVYRTQIDGLSGSFPYDWTERKYLGVECYHAPGDRTEA